MGQYLDILAADAAGHHAEADAAFKALRKAQAAHPRLQARAAEVAIFGTVAQAVDAAARPCFDRDYGPNIGHPLDPRNEPGEADDMVLCIEEAERCIAMARRLLSEAGIPGDRNHVANLLAARSLMTEASGYLAED